MDQMIAMGWEREKCLEHVQGQGINEFTMEAQLRNPGRVHVDAGRRRGPVRRVVCEG